jgi:hypothetical protein
MQSCLPRRGGCALFLGRSALAALIVVSLSAAAEAQSASPSPGVPTEQQLREELQRLREEFEQIRDAYGARLSALEARLAGASPEPAATGTPLTTAAEQAAVPADPAGGVPVPPGAGGAGGPQGALPVYGGASAASKIFNPDIAVIGNFLGAVGTNDVSASPVFEMSEAEATFQAVVDPYARADFFLAFSPEGVEIEEGYLTFSSLPGGLLTKVGRMKQQVGKVNTLHPHAISWVDRPLVLENLLGGEEGLADAGVSVSKLIPNRALFLEATGEVYQGTSGVFASDRRRDVSWVGRLRGYRDLGEADNLDLGASFAYGANDAGTDKHTRLVTVDATVPQRPLQRAL